MTEGQRHFECLIFHRNAYDRHPLQVRTPTAWIVQRSRLRGYRNCHLWLWEELEESSQEFWDSQAEAVRGRKTPAGAKCFAAEIPRGHRKLPNGILIFAAVLYYATHNDLFALVGGADAGGLTSGERRHLRRRDSRANGDRCDPNFTARTKHND